jgi:hypothetical protein
MSGIEYGYIGNDEDLNLIHLTCHFLCSSLRILPSLVLTVSATNVCQTCEIDEDYHYVLQCPILQLKEKSNFKIFIR